MRQQGTWTHAPIMHAHVANCTTKDHLQHTAACPNKHTTSFLPTCAHTAPAVSRFVTSGTAVSLGCVTGVCVVCSYTIMALGRMAVRRVNLSGTNLGERGGMGGGKGARVCVKGSGRGGLLANAASATVS
jgi:hypothetical protein